MLRCLLLKLFCFFSTAFAASISIEIPFESAEVDEVSSTASGLNKITAVSTPTVDSVTSTHSSPLFQHLKSGEVLKNITAAQNLILEKCFEGESIEFVENCCRYQDAGDLFAIINNAGFEELAFHCAQNFQTFSWYYILDRVKYEAYTENIIVLLKKFELLLVTFGPRYKIDPHETSIALEALRANNEAVCEFIRQKVSDKVFARLLKVE